MDEHTLVSRLAELTGALAPLDDAAPDVLAQARRFVADALLGGQLEPISDGSDIGSFGGPLEALPPATVEALLRVVHDAVPAPRDPSLRIFRRSWPLLADGLPSSVPKWATGWSVERSLGPFESAEGALVWFDVRRTTHSLLVVDAQAGNSLIKLPQGTTPAGPTATVLELPGGTVWLDATLFDAQAPAGAFAGIRIAGGTISFGHPVAVLGNVLQARRGSVATLVLRPARMEPPPRTRHGGDARKANANPPERVVFTLSVGAHAALIEAAPANLEVYGTGVQLQGREDAPARYDDRLGRLMFALAPQHGPLRILDARSQVFRPAGGAPVRDAWWAVPVAATRSATPLELGEAAGAGALALSGLRGLKADEFALLPAHVIPLERAQLLVEPGQLCIVAEATTANQRRTLDLWRSNPETVSRVEITAPASVQLRFDATTAGGGAETLAVSPVTCRGEFDRPMTAAGQRVPFASRSASLYVLRHLGAMRLALVAPAEPALDTISGAELPGQACSFALSNALLRTSQALALLLFVAVDDALSPLRGTLGLYFRLRWVLPSLPDPYAANTVPRAPRERREGDLSFSSNRQPAAIVARVRWSGQAQPDTTFELRARPELDVSASFLRIDDPPLQAWGPNRRDYLPDVEARFPGVSGHGPDRIRLLDVSTKADLFGIGYAADSSDARLALGVPLQLRVLDLVAPVRAICAFTLPAFQWEPVYNLPNPNAAPFPDKLVSSTDGGPARFAMPLAQLVSAAPLPLLRTLLEEYERRNDAVLAARFTLPFGMVAVAELHRTRRSPDPLRPVELPPHFGSVRPRFRSAGLDGGEQLTIRAPGSPLSAGDDPSRALSGATAQTDNGAGGFNVLKSGDVDSIFNQTFADKRPRVPVARIDFSGRGASTFSDWRRTDDNATGVTQVKFEALVGRTAHEVVQVRSRLYPWGAIVVRIITMQRTGSGGVFRRDSGWQAASDAEYRLPAGCFVHAGVVPRLVDIRRIRDTSSSFERAYTLPDGTQDVVKLVQVLFDADVDVEGVTRGANAAGRVPVRDIVGYVQVAPVGADGNIKNLTPAQLDDMLAATGPVGGPIDCELNVAQSGLHMRASRIEVDRTQTLGGAPQCAAVARGTVELPSAGQWTFAYQGVNETEAHALDAGRPIPLIRADPAGGVVPPYRFADASELHRPNNPRSAYSLLHSTGAQRMLVPQPQVVWGDAAIQAGSPMLFADMYALAGGVALFARPEDCHPLPAGSSLRIIGRKKIRLTIPAQPGLGPGEFKVGPLERTLHQSASLRLRSRYFRSSTAWPDSSIKLHIDSDAQPDWLCTFGPVSMVTDIDDMEELQQVVGHVTSSSAAAPEFKEPKLVFGPPLAPVNAIIDFLTAFGLPIPLAVSITNEKYGYKSGTKYSFPPPGLEELIDKAIKQGLGLMLRLELALGQGIESESASELQRRIHTHPLSPARGEWHSYLEASSKLLVKTVELTPLLKLFLGGAFKFELAAESKSASKVTFQWGVTGVVELDLVILTVSGGRTYSAVFQRMIGQKKVGIGFATEWEVEGSLLAGLVAVKLSFEVLALVEKTTDYHFTGEATLAFDVTLGWVFSKSYEVEFEMSETFAAMAFVALTVLPVK